jgi:CHAT domain-containing protein
LQDNPNRQIQTDLWQNKGRALSNDRKNYTQSLSLLNKALTYYKADKDSASIASTAIEMAKNYLHQGNHAAAITYANQALSLRELLKNAKSVECYIVLGEIAEAQQNPDSALFFYQKALQSIDVTFKNNDVLTNPTIDAKAFNRKIELIQLLAHKGGPLSINAKKTKNKAYLEAALRAYQLADKLVQVLRRQMQDDQSKYFWNETALPIYKKALDVASQLWDLTQHEKYKLTMLQFAERTKAPVLREGIADNQAKGFAGVPASDRQREHELCATIAILEKQPDNNAAATAFLTKTQMQLYAFQDSLKTEYPTYSRYLDATNQDAPLSINDLKSTQNQLSDSTLLIEFAFGEKDVYQIAISNTDFKIFKTPLTSDFYTQIDRFIQSVSDVDAIKKDFNATSKAYSETSFDVYQRLLEQPLKTFNAQKIIKRIHLVLDNQLHLLPFKALTDCPIRGWIGDYTNHCLVQQYAISCLFSIQTLLKKGPSVSAPFSGEFKLACFGLDFRDSTLWHQNTPKTGGIRKKNNILVNAEPEITGIASQFNGRFYFNQTATKDTFLKVAPLYDVLHITTHGYPECLVFQKKNATDSLNEILISDIYSLPLHTRFTFLSACETGHGKITEAEGVMSLGRAFTYAGSQSVIMTLWSIPDGATSMIAQNFYVYCRQGIPKDIAEQRAEIDYLNSIKSDKQALPINWAALTIIGDMSPLEVGKSASKWWLGGLLAGIVLVGLLLFSNRLRSINNAPVSHR